MYLIGWKSKAWTFIGTNSASYQQLHISNISWFNGKLWGRNSVWTLVRRFSYLLMEYYCFCPLSCFTSLFRTLVIVCGFIEFFLPLKNIFSNLYERIFLLWWRNLIPERTSAQKENILEVNQNVVQTHWQSVQTLFTEAESLWIQCKLKSVSLHLFFWHWNIKYILISYISVKCTCIGWLYVYILMFSYILDNDNRAWLLALPHWLNCVR